MTSSRRLPAIVALLVSFVLFSGGRLVSAQTTASIEGMVTDSTGGALPGVSIEVTNEETGISRSVVTEADGRYRARDLSLGNYKVDASLQGFGSASRRGIQLTIGRQATVDFQLSVGDLAETVEVTGDAPLVDTKSAGVASLVSREQMADLPLNARDFSQLIDLQAGTVHVRAEISGANAGSAAGARISISGARPSANVFVLDGTEIQTAYGTLPSGVGGATLGLEAVQEFKVLSSNYSAQYGRSVGGTVVAATRSGTNAFRGTGYWYHRNEKFDARNYFDVGPKPDFSRNQFGAGFGGPIIKSRTFFFGNYEVLRERLPRALSAVVPTVLARQGILPTRTVTVSPVVKPYLDLYPLPNGRDFGDGTAEYNTNGDRPTDQTYVSLRVDHQINDKTSMFGRMTRDVSELTAANAIPIISDSTLSRSHYYTVEMNRIVSPRIVNQTRVGFTRSVIGSAPVSVNAPDPSLSFFKGRPFGTLNISGLTALSGGTGGANTDTVDALIFGDDLTFDAGRHSLHAGGSFTILDFERISFGERFSGQWEFGSVVNFLTNGAPTRLRISGFNADPTRDYRNKLLALYLQDDIRLTANMVLNIGTRFEYTTTPTEAEGRLANLRNITDAVPTVGEPYYQQPGGFFSPRVGLVWDPNGSGRTSIRTGFGFFHEPLQMKYYVVTMTRQPPFWTEVDPTAAQLVGLFPDVTNQLERLTREAPQAIHVFQYDPANPYSMQGSLSVQHQLASDLVAEVGWVGTWGVHLPGRKEWAVPVRTIVNGESFFDVNAPYVNPNFTRLNYYDTHAASEYHGLKATITKRMSMGLHFQGAYTLSRAMDTESATIAGELEGTSVSDPYDPSRDWGPAQFDVRHVFTGSASYRLPWGENLQGVARGLVAGWQVSGIFTAAGGRPFQVTSNSQITHALLRTTTRPDLAAGGDPNPILGGVDQYFDPLQFVPQRRGFLGNLGRNTLVGPGVAKLDLSAVKEFSLPGGRSAQLRAELFNVTNRASFGQPATSLFNANQSRIASAGRITSTSTSARQGQIAIRVAF